MDYADNMLDEKERRLWQIAKRVLASERTYTEEHVKAKLEAYLKVSPERAEKGFNLMVTESVLVPTFGEPRKYCLGDTTPF